MLAKKGTLLAPTTPGLVTYDSGLGAEIKAMLFFAGRQREEGVTPDNFQGVMLAVVTGAGPGDQRCHSIRVVDHLLTSSARKQLTERVVFSIATHEKATFAGFGTGVDAGKFTLNWTLQAPVPNFLYHFVALGGLEARVKEEVMPTTPGEVSFSGYGVGQPDLVLLLSSSALGLIEGDAGGTAAHAKLSIGAATSSTKRWAQCLTARDGQSKLNRLDCERRQSSAACLLGLTTGTPSPPTGPELEYSADFVGMEPDGYRLNFTTAPASPYRFTALALKGIAADVGLFQACTTPGCSNDLTVPGTPRLLLLSTLNSAALDAQVPDVEVYLGAGDGVDQGTAGGRAEDATLPTQADQLQKTTKVLAMLAAGDPATIEAEAAHVLAPGGARVTWTDEPPAPVQVGYVALGDPA